MNNRILCAMIGLLSVMFIAATSAKTIGPWNIDSIRKVPDVTWIYKADTGSKFTLNSEIYKGQPVKYTLNYYLPANRTGKVPAMIYCEGSSGSPNILEALGWAYRGYAAIAPDLAKVQNNAPRTFGGSTNPADYFLYQRAAMLSHLVSWLSIQPEIDSTRIGIFGGSWGAVTAMLAAGIDDRYREVIICAGSGYMAETYIFKPMILSETSNDADKDFYNQTFDPKNLIPYMKMPILWLNETMDLYFEPQTSYKSRQLTSAPITNCIVVDGHEGHCTFANAQIRAFADTYSKPGTTTPLASITGQGHDGVNLWLTYASVSPVRSADVHYTAWPDDTPWGYKTWSAVTAQLEAAKSRVTATVPATATVAYMDIVDSLGRMVSSEYFAVNSKIFPPPVKIRQDSRSLRGRRQGAVAPGRKPRLPADGKGTLFDLRGKSIWADRLPMGVVLVKTSSRSGLSTREVVVR